MSSSLSGWPSCMACSTTCQCCWMPGFLCSMWATSAMCLDSRCRPGTKCCSFHCHRHSMVEGRSVHVEVLRESQAVAVQMSLEAMSPWSPKRLWLRPKAYSCAWSCRRLTWAFEHQWWTNRWTHPSSPWWTLCPQHCGHGTAAPCRGSPLGMLSKHGEAADSQWLDWPIRCRCQALSDDGTFAPSARTRLGRWTWVWAPLRYWSCSCLWRRRRWPHCWSRRPWSLWTWWCCSRWSFCWANFE